MHLPDERCPVVGGQTQFESDEMLQDSFLHPVHFLEKNGRAAYLPKDIYVVSRLFVVMISLQIHIISRAVSSIGYRCSTRRKSLPYYVQLCRGRS